MCGEVETVKRSCHLLKDTEKQPPNLKRRRGGVSFQKRDWGVSTIKGRLCVGKDSLHPERELGMWKGGMMHPEEGPGF